MALRPAHQPLYRRLRIGSSHLARLHGRYLLRRKTTGELDIVEALKERIPEQNRVEKGDGGRSVALAASPTWGALFVLAILALARVRFDGLSHPPCIERRGNSCHP